MTVSNDELPEDLGPRFNIAPSQPLPVIRTPGRLERASNKASSRCLVVVDGFYEWREVSKLVNSPKNDDPRCVRRSASYPDPDWSRVPTPSCVCLKASFRSSITASSTTSSGRS